MRFLPVSRICMRSTRGLYAARYVCASICAPCLMPPRHFIAPLRAVAAMALCKHADTRFFCAAICQQALRATAIFPRAHARLRCAAMARCFDATRRFICCRVASPPRLFVAMLMLTPRLGDCRYARSEMLVRRVCQLRHARTARLRAELRHLRCY